MTKCHEPGKPPPFTPRKKSVIKRLQTWTSELRNEERTYASGNEESYHNVHDFVGMEHR